MRIPLSRLVDAALAAALLVAGVAEIWVPFSSRQGDGSPYAGTVVVVIAAAALLARRTRPLPAGLVVLAVWPVTFSLVDIHVLFFGQFIPMAVAVFSMARHGTGRVPAIGGAAGAAALLYIDFFVPELQSPGEIVFHWGVFTIVWGFGLGLHRYEESALRSTWRAIGAEVAAAEQAMAAVVAERTRIARELHDIVAHAVSIMVVQAGAAGQVVDDDPDEVRRALEAIRVTGTEALAEMRRLVEVLRDDEAADLAPQPGLNGVPALVDGVRSAGLVALLDESGQPRILPAGLDLTAYRIVQEALTNVRRHARAATVKVSLLWEAETLRIEVADDGVGGPATSDEGHGLAGMRERAALYGGQVECGSTDGVGYVVRAVLPLGAA